MWSILSISFVQYLEDDLSELNKADRSEHQIIRVDLEHVHNSKMIIINDTQKSL